MSVEVVGYRFVAFSTQEESRRQMSSNGSSKGGYQRQLQEYIGDIEPLLCFDEEEDDSIGHTSSEAIRNDQLS